jgi:hypothetical protein
MSSDELSQLVREWEQIAKRKFYDAQCEKDPMGRRLIEHGAMCYFNCAQDLREYLNASSLQPSTIEGARQT